MYNNCNNIKYQQKINMCAYLLNKIDLDPLLSGDDDVTYTSNVLLFAAASFIACSTTLDFE